MSVTQIKLLDAIGDAVVEAVESGATPSEVREAVENALAEVTVNAERKP